MNNPFLVQEENKQKIIDLFEFQNIKSKEIVIQPFTDEFDIRIPFLDNGEVKFHYSHFIHDILEAENTLFFFKGLSEISTHTQKVIFQSLLLNNEHSNKICFLIKDFNHLSLNPSIWNRIIAVR